MNIQSQILAVGEDIEEHLRGRGEAVESTQFGLPLRGWTSLVLTMQEPSADISPDDPAPDSLANELQLWDLWRSGRDAGARAQLLEHHLPYARVVAASYYRKRFHNEIEFDEYLQLARLGLIESMERFDPSVGVQFRTFAARRMHGAILDGLELLTEKQQQLAVRRQLQGERRTSIKELNAADGKSAPTGVPGSQQQVLQYVAQAGLAFALAWILDGTGMVENGDKAESMPFYRGVELRELRQRILDLVQALPAQELKVIRGHYLQEQPFDEIASSMGLTRGRISQIHRKALGRLRETLAARPSCDLAL